MLLVPCASPQLLCVLQLTAGTQWAALGLLSPLAWRCLQPCHACSPCPRILWPRRTRKRCRSPLPCPRASVAVQSLLQSATRDWAEARALLDHIPARAFPPSPPSLGPRKGLRTRPPSKLYIHICLRPSLRGPGSRRGLFTSF